MNGVSRTLRFFRPRNQVRWLARLAFFALLFQISALDHHTHNIEEITGVIGSSEHEMHCHAAVGTCVSGASELPTLVTQTALLPTQPALILFDTATDDEVPADAHVDLGSEPPRI